MPEENEIIAGYQQEMDVELERQRLSIATKVPLIFDEVCRNANIVNRLEKEADELLKDIRYVVSYGVELRKRQNRRI